MLLDCEVSHEEMSISIAGKCISCIINLFTTALILHRRLMEDVSDSLLLVIY